MKLIRGGVLFAGLLGVAAATHAGVSSTWTVVSDYDFRGITQSAQDPALQGSLDYAHDSGFYAGLWGSSIDFGPGDPNMELDLYTGFSNSLDFGLEYDVGVTWYTYPSESSLNYVELYAGLGFTAASGLSISGKYFFSPDWGGSSTPGSPTAQYISADLSYPLPKNFGLSVHAGYSFGDFWDDLKAEGGGSAYFDYSIGLDYTAGKFSLGLKWIDGSDLKESDGTPGDIFSSESRVVFSVATTFPWGE
jgi:uncharacterized protein (TIGR02001 family)